MMAGPVAVWGIDVGRCALKAIKLRPGTDGQVEVVQAECLEHPAMMSDAEGNQYQVISEALERFQSKHDISKAKIVVAVPGQHTLARFSKLPPVEAKKIPDIVRYEADQQIPFDLDEVVWDYQTFQEEDSPDVEVGIFAIKQDLIRDYLLPFEQSGIEPLAVQAAPMALFNAMHFEQRLEEGASVLLDVGADNTNLIVATRHGLWTRTIPLGGNKFTDALVKSFKLTFAKAENLKRTAASSKYARQVFQAMRPVFAQFVQELSRSLGFYRSTHRDTELKRMIGLGNAFKLPGLQKYLQQNLQMPVDRPDTFKMAGVSELRDQDAFKEHLPSLVVAYGLAIQGLEVAKAMPTTSPIQSNLLPPEIVKQVVWRKKRPYFAAAAACLLLASGIVWFRRQTDLATLAANAGQPVSKVSFAQATTILRSGVPNAPARQEGAMWLEVAKAFKDEMNKYKNQGQAEVERSAEIVRLQRNKAVWPRILAAVHGALPQPPEALAAAGDPIRYAAAIKADRTGKLARGERTEVFIEAFEAEYHDDVSKEDVFFDVGLKDELDVVEGAGDDAKPGFVLTLDCRTPNRQGYQFVASAFRDALISPKYGRRPGMGFYINRAAITHGRDFGQKDDKGGRKGRPPRGRPPRGRPPRGRPPRDRDKPPPPVAKYDPVTDEPMDKDWVFEMKVEVVLADLPEKKKDDAKQP